jgi:hypothetical protein
VVIHEATANENEVSAKVACPHCWHLNHILIGENAALSKDFRAEKV